MAVKLKSESEAKGSKKKKEKKKKSVFREWLDAIIFAVVAATIIRWAFISAYTIPTSSMESTQLVGDFLFVSKMAYGPRTPKTILRLPLTDNKIWGTNIPSYLPWIQLPMLRLGFMGVERGDVVVFNWPEEEAPVDMKTHYIKRCVGIPGDKLSVKEGLVYIDGEASPVPPGVQFRYLLNLKPGRTLSDRLIDRYELGNYFSIGELAKTSQSGQYYVYTTPNKAKALEALDPVAKVVLQQSPEGEARPDTYPQSPKFDWNEDFFGPLTIPAEGMEIEINEENLAIYGKVIKRFEWNEDVVIEGDKLSIEGKEVKNYTFKQDYYFMMGDNRHNSLDSRFWGFVPADHVVGEALITWLSLDYQKSFFSRVRWERVFKPIY